MRSRPLLAVLVAVSAVAVTVVVAPPTTFAAPAGCTASGSGIVLACDHAYPTVRPLKGIGLLGDSVMLGSSPGMSTPSLPSLLAAKGWGPIRMTTTLGMRTYNGTTTSASAYHVLGKWKAAGFSPRIIAVNLGANHFLDCTNATVGTCIARINQLMDRIQSLYPGATVWWSLTNQYDLRTGGYSAGMLAWNLALARVAAARPGKLVLWDWPAALKQLGITTDPFGIHPSSATQYVKRSTAMADDLTSRMPTVSTGPAEAIPNNGNSPLGFTPSKPLSLLPATALTANVGVPVAVPGTPTAAAVTVTMRSATADGYVKVTPTCGSPSIGTRLYFTPGKQRSGQAITALSGGSLCITATQGVTAVVTLQGSFSAAAADRLTPVAITNTLASFTPTTGGYDATVTVPGANPTNDAAAVTLVVNAAGTAAGGTVTVSDCVQAPAADAVHASYAAREIVSAQVFAPVDTATQHLCVHVATTGAAPQVYVRVTGLFGVTGLLFRPVSVARVLEMGPRYRHGGWSGRLFPGQAITLGVPNDVRAASMVVTVNEATAPGAVTAWRRGIARPGGLFYFPAGTRLASNTLTVGVTPGPVTPNGGFAVGDIGRVAVERLAVDIVGWWVQ